MIKIKITLMTYTQGKRKDVVIDAPSLVTVSGEEDQFMHGWRMANAAAQAIKAFSPETACSILEIKVDV